MGIPALPRKVADEYLAVRWLLSRTTITFTPRSYAARSAFAIRADVNEYTCTRISCLALLSSLTTTSVAPPPGEKNTPMVGVSGEPTITGRDGEVQERPRRKIKPTKRRGLNAFIRRRVTDGSG